MSTNTSTPPTAVINPHTGKLYDFRPFFDYLNHQSSDIDHLVCILVWAGKYTALSFTHSAGIENEITEVVLQLPNLAEALRHIEAE